MKQNQKHRPGIFCAFSKNSRPTAKKLKAHFGQKTQPVGAQWFPMCQFGFENYATQIEVQIGNFYEGNHLKVFSSHCPSFQSF